MKKKILSIIFVTTLISAQSNPGIKPGHPFYFLDRAIERIQLLLTFDRAKRAELHLKLAEERLIEIREILETKPEFIPNLTKDYQENLNRSMAIKNKTKIVIKASSHIEILENISTPKTKPLIKEVVNISTKACRDALDKLEKEYPTESARLWMEFADKRLKLARKKAERGEIEELEDLIKEYETESTKSYNLTKRFENITALAEHICSMIYKHIEVLEGVYEEVPDEAKPVIERVINQMLERHENCTERMIARLNRTQRRLKRFTCKTNEDCINLTERCPAVGYEPTCITPPNRTEGFCTCLPVWRRRINCTTDADCENLVCPQIIGHDTPICREGRCTCGAKWELNRTEWGKRFRERWTNQTKERLEKVRELYNKTKIREYHKGFVSGTCDGITYEVNCTDAVCVVVCKSVGPTKLQIKRPL